MCVEKRSCEQGHAKNKVIMEILVRMFVLGVLFICYQAVVLSVRFAKMPSSNVFNKLVVF